MSRSQRAAAPAAAPAAGGGPVLEPPPEDFRLEGAPDDPICAQPKATPQPRDPRTVAVSPMIISNNLVKIGTVTKGNYYKVLSTLIDRPHEPLPRKIGHRDAPTRLQFAGRCVVLYHQLLGLNLPEQVLNHPQLCKGPGAARPKVHVEKFKNGFLANLLIGGIEGPNAPDGRLNSYRFKEASLFEGFIQPIVEFFYQYMNPDGVLSLDQIYGTNVQGWRSNLVEKVKKFGVWSNCRICHTAHTEENIAETIGEELLTVEYDNSICRGLPLQHAYFCVMTIPNFYKHIDKERCYITKAEATTHFWCEEMYDERLYSSSNMSIPKPTRASTRRKYERKYEKLVKEAADIEKNIMDAYSDRGKKLMGIKKSGERVLTEEEKEFLKKEHNQSMQPYKDLLDKITRTQAELERQDSVRVPPAPKVDIDTTTQGLEDFVDLTRTAAEEMDGENAADGKPPAKKKRRHKQRARTTRVQIKIPNKKSNRTPVVDPFNCDESFIDKEDDDDESMNPAEVTREEEEEEDED